MRQPVPFGKYLLLDRISVGGMAEVFKAKSYGVEGFEKIIAIKRILPTMGEDRDFIKMFIDEAKIAGQLAHANICQIFELGRIDGSHFIAMEYIWGKDLLQIQNRLRKNKLQMPIPMACFCIAKVLEGLDYAHRKRDPLGRPLEIVHRDCSPQNVLVSYEGEVKVIDFGIAKATSRNSRTMAGVLKGKFGYMSPEQVRGLPLDRRSDIFAIGTMLYECLTGERLFQGETDFSTLEKVRNVDIQAPRTINPAIPEAIEKVILKALAKDVDDRYQWCSEMLTDLQAYLMSQDVVFTAKSLSGWLKDVFQQEIDRERQLLEQYKRVGRDGLIAGATAAAATGDVNQNLGAGEAPEPSDATQLGGPSFEEMEQGVGATPDVNQSPMSPAVGGPRGSVQRAAASPQKAKSGFQQADEEGEGDFGEEAPTEIFGDDGAPPPSSGSIGRQISPPPAAAGKGPAKPPPGARVTAPRAAEVTSPIPPSQPMAASGPVGRTTAPGPAAAPPTAADSLSAMTAAATPSSMPYAPPYGTPQGGSGPIGVGGVHFAGGAAASGGLQKPGDSGEINRTVMGVSAPPGLPNYANNPPTNGGAPYRPSGQQSTPSMQPPPSAVASYPNYPVQQSGPSQNPSYPSYPQQPYGQQPSGPYAQQSGPYGQQPYGAPYQQSSPMNALPIDQAAPVEGKRSTLMRDIGIGVGIAALVLVGFLVVKLVVLDDSSSTGDSASANAKFATVKLSMPPSMTAEMFVDGTRVGTVAHDQTVGVKAGTKHIKLVGNNGVTCDDEKVNLEAGKTTTLECGLGSKPAAGSAAAGSAAATGSAAGSAATVVAQGAGSGSAKTSATTTEVKADTSKTDAKTDTTKSDVTKSDVKTDTSKSDTSKTSTSSKTDSSKTDSSKTDSSKTDSSKTDSSKTSTSSKTDSSSSKTGTSTKTGSSSTKTSTKSGGDAVKGDPTKGYLNVYSKPTAKILVDGAETGMKTPIEGNKLALTPGKHKITFVIGDDRFTYPIIIKAGQTESMSKDLQ